MKKLKMSETLFGFKSLTLRQFIHPKQGLHGLAFGNIHSLAASTDIVPVNGEEGTTFL